MRRPPKIHLHNAVKYLNNAVYTNSIFADMPSFRGKKIKLWFEGVCCVLLTIHQRLGETTRKLLMGTRSVCRVQFEAGSAPLQSKWKLAFSRRQYDKFAAEKNHCVGLWSPLCKQAIQRNFDHKIVRCPLVAQLQLEFVFIGWIVIYKSSKYLLTPFKLPTLEMTS